MPGHARARPGHDSARTRPADPDRPATSPFSHRLAVTSATSQTPPIDRGQAVDDDFVLDRRHCTSVHAYVAADLDYPLLRQDAPKDCLDVTNSPMTLPCPFRACSVVSFLDLTAPPRHSSPSIKGDHPETNSSHKLALLFSLALLEH
jgi:hypothetical protein